MDKVQPIDYWRKARGERITPPERQLLFDLAQRTVERFDHPLIVNIGVSWGASLHCLVAGAPYARHMAIDIDYERRPVHGIEILSTVEFITGNSQVMPISDPVHLVFVDGDHSYSGVLSDIIAWTPVVGGVIAFHDYKPQERDKRRLAGVRRAVDEIYRGGGWRLCGAAGSVMAFERVEK